MKVCKGNIRTPCEELEYLKDQYFKAGSFFSWEVHPNRLRASDAYEAKLRKKMRWLIDSAQYKDYTGAEHPNL